MAKWAVKLMKHFYSKITEIDLIKSVHVMHIHRTLYPDCKKETQERKYPQ